GQFAVVKRCIQRRSGKEFAAKFIKKKRTKSSRRGVAIEDVEREVNILKNLNHENIVQLFDVFDNGNEVILILELVRGGELFDLLSGNERLSERDAIAYIKQILVGLKHMHEKNIAHLDLKPENIMLLENQNTHRIKLIDFGLSRLLLSNNDVREMMGTPEFVAPEIISYEPVTLASDMWSLGVITYNLLSGTSPFLGESKQDTFANITAVNYKFDEEYFSEISNEGINFITKLLVRDPRKRNTVYDCLNHPWIAKEEINIFRCVINVDQIKSHTAYLRWKHTVKVISLCNRLSRNLKVRQKSENLSINSVISSISTVQNNKETEEVM
ncbi:death-associated protein kinase 1-like protein, partial [Dinothrombium tinctorium]